MNKIQFYLDFKLLQLCQKHLEGAQSTFMIYRSVAYISYEVQVYPQAQLQLQLHL